MNAINNTEDTWLSDGYLDKCLTFQMKQKYKDDILNMAYVCTTVYSQNAIYLRSWHHTSMKTQTWAPMWNFDLSNLLREKWGSNGKTSHRKMLYSPFASYITGFISFSHFYTLAKQSTRYSRRCLFTLYWHILNVLKPAVQWGPNA